MKHVSTWVCVMMVIYYVEATLPNKQNEEDKGDGLIHNAGYNSAKKRERRMVAKLMTFVGKASKAVLRGRKATIQLITGAKQVKAEETYIIYEKRGNLESALKDYGAIKPSPTRTYNDDAGGFIWIAKVGDRNIMLKERGLKNMPEIKIITDKMVYSVLYRQRATGS